MEIPQSYIIHDIRSSRDFKGVTISGYKRKDVINAYQNSIINNKLEDSIRWCVELHSTGLNKVIWDILKNIYFKSIHINNPKYFFYINKRENDYKKILKNYIKQHEIYTRNNQEIRNIYAELTAISCLSKKTAIILPKINQISFEKEEIKRRMISKNLDKISNFIYNNTSNETKFALNEIYKNLRSEKGTVQNCIYWYLWLEKAEQNKKKQQNDVNFVNKQIMEKSYVKDVKENEYFDHWVYILWNIIESFEYKIEIENKNNYIYLKKIINNYKSDFKLSLISKKKYYFFISFYIIKSEINWSFPLFSNEYLIIQSNANINRMYENIIINNKSKLSDENIKKLKKLYNKSYYEMLNKKNNIKIPRKIVDNNLDEEINKIEFTKDSNFKYLKNTENKKDEINYINNNYKEENYGDDNPKKLIYKNMTKKDVLNSIEERRNKKLNAFTQLITFKKKESNIFIPKNNSKNNLEIDNSIEKNTVIDTFEKLENIIPEIKKIIYKDENREYKKYKQNKQNKQKINKNILVNIGKKNLDDGHLKNEEQQRFPNKIINLDNNYSTEEEITLDSIDI